MNNRELIKKITDSASVYPDGTFAQGDGCRIYTCINSTSYRIWRKMSGLYERFDGIFVDGIQMCLLIRMFFFKKIPRISCDMTGIAKELFGRLSNNGKSVYLIGARQDEIERCVKQIKNAYPKIKIAGFRNGYLTGQDDIDDAIHEIIASLSDFVLVGMGTPKQDEFAVRLKDADYRGIVFTCGGFLRQTSSGIDYYPAWIDRYNLRWLYRQCTERGIFRRNYDTLVATPACFLYDSITTKLKK